MFQHPVRMVIRWNKHGIWRVYQLYQPSGESSLPLQQTDLQIQISSGCRNCFRNQPNILLMPADSPRNWENAQNRCVTCNMTCDIMIQSSGLLRIVLFRSAFGGLASHASPEDTSRRWWVTSSAWDGSVNQEPQAERLVPYGKPDVSSRSTKKFCVFCFSR